LDHCLEVPLHGLGLSLELVPVRAREPSPGLRLELVAGEVLELERESVRHVGYEIGGALAGDSVQEIE